MTCQEHCDALFCYPYGLGSEALMIDVRWRELVLEVAWMCQIVVLALCNRRAFSACELRDIHKRLGKKVYTTIDKLTAAVTRDARRSGDPEWRLEAGSVRPRAIAEDSDTCATGPDSDGDVIDENRRAYHSIAYGLKFLPHWVLHFDQCLMEDGSTTAGNTIASEASHRLNCRLIWQLVSKQGGAASVEFRMEQLTELLELFEDILALVPQAPPERSQSSTKTRPPLVCACVFDVQPLQVS